MNRILRLGFAVVLALIVLIQLIPIRPSANPPVVAEPPWNSPETRALAKRACFDCHSNETVWPAYAYVAPISWLVVHDTLDGRRHLNFSEWGVAQQSGEGERERRGRREDPAEEAGEVIERGEMPPRSYTLIHAAARLTDAEKQQLIDGLAISLRMR